MHRMKKTFSEKIGMKAGGKKHKDTELEDGLVMEISRFERDSKRSLRERNTPTFALYPGATLTTLTLPRLRPLLEAGCLVVAAAKPHSFGRDISLP